MSLPLPTTIFVCTTCRRGEETFEPAELRSGFKFHAALEEAAQNNATVQVIAVECLSNCKRGCNVTYAGQGKWSYGFGDLDPVTQLQDVLDVAKLHFDAVDGVIPWAERPDAIRKKTMSRTPPLPA